MDGGGNFFKGVSALKNQLTGHLMALFVSIIWGTTFISTKLLLQGGLHPVEIIIFRFILAWLFLFLLSPKPLKPRGWKAELPFMAAGLTGLTIYFLFENTALTYTLASNCGIILSTAPMFTALMLWLSRRTPRPRWTFFLGFVIAMAGICIISLGGSKLELNPLGDLLILGAALSWGAYGVCLEMTSGQGYSNLQATRKIFFWGLLFTLLCIPFYGGQLSFELTRFSSPVMIFNILYLSAGASALCFILWNKAIHIIGSVSTNLYIYLTPVITLTASALILGEPITPTAIGAVVLIILGLWLSQKKPRTAAPAEAEGSEPQSKEP